MQRGDASVGHEKIRRGLTGQTLDLWLAGNTHGGRFLVVVRGGPVATNHCTTRMMLDSVLRCRGRRAYLLIREGRPVDSIRGRWVGDFVLCSIYLSPGRARAGGWRTIQLSSHVFLQAISHWPRFRLRSKAAQEQGRLQSHRKPANDTLKMVSAAAIFVWKTMQRC